MTSVRTESSMKYGCEQQAQISESALRKHMLLVVNYKKKFTELISC